MTGFKVYDVGGIASAIMKLELIYAEIFSPFFRLYKLLAVIGCIDTLETLFINLLDRVFTQPGDLSHLLVCISSPCKQITGILMKRIRNEMPFSLKGYKLALGGSAFRTTELVVRKQQPTQVSANAEVTDINIRM